MNDGVRRFTDDITKKFTDFQGIVFRHLFLFLAIELPREQQAFVQQCLDSFLEILEASAVITAAVAVEEKADENDLVGSS